MVFVGNLKLAQQQPWVTKHRNEALDEACHNWDAQEMEERHMKDLGMKPGHIIKLKLNPGSNNLRVMLV